MLPLDVQPKQAQSVTGYPSNLRQRDRPHLCPSLNLEGERAVSQETDE